jgi:hypothetical protein
MKENDGVYGSGSPVSGFALGGRPLPGTLRMASRADLSYSGGISTEMKHVKVTIEETNGDLMIAVEKRGIYRLFSFFKVIFKRLGMFNNKILRF